MRAPRVIFGILTTAIMIALIFTIYFYLKALSYEVTINGQEEEKEYDYHFSLIVQEYNNPYLVELSKGAQEAARQNNISLEYRGPRQTNFEEHIKMIEKSIASKVDGIITQGLSEDFIPVIQKAEEMGIPVITIDTDLKASGRKTYIGTDNYQAGFQVGLKVIEENQAKTKVGIIAGDLETNQHSQRVEGFLDAVKSATHIEIAAIEASNLSNIQATEKTYQMLQDHPDIEVFFGTSAMDGQGIASAIDIYRPQRKIKVYAFDDLEENMELLKEGKLHAVIQQLPYDMGYESIRLMTQLKKGTTIETDHYTDVHILQKDDVLHNR
ncbi:substrate-binding domain-containing protein [Lederbergia sp. NSJ-179]|uniref:substrate-binding domain-containing protein n=1 Tax=Lederbergia sp. NSJ-179 TaxID=2931402 RepID=UPI001FD207EF|nr:substrate-binding domain-containing protein [Lederbergia sp. NSJ-179]MCJ7840486.1 substrate-binding domain-containing protein [Lederbergia sp. NSJ-179]